MQKKMVLAVIIAIGITAAASAQVTISGGFALSYATIEGDISMDGEVGYGGNVYVDYLLPVGIPLSLGAEVGYDTSSFTEGDVTLTVGAIPLLARVAYHFDLNPKLDLYLVGKIGYAVGILTATGGDVTADPKGGLGIGFDIGAAWYFTSSFGIFAEGGFDRYALSAETNGGGTVDTPFNRFFTLGVSLKF